ncbi:MAG: hypothetical protein WBW04_09955 [Nitrolancea sp.]
MSSEYDLAAAREKVQTIVKHVKSDESYAKELKNDPIGTLQSAGLDDTTIAEFLREEGWSDDVSGYSLLKVQPIGSFKPPSIAAPGSRLGAPGAGGAQDCLATCVCTSCCVSVSI